MRYVIVGTGPAGVIAAETLRGNDPAAEVMMIGAEAGPPYARMALPYLLSGLVDERGTWLRRSETHLADQGITVYGDRVTSVDTTARELQLEQHGSIRFDRLLVATGASPITPPVPGMDLPGVCHCWTLEDARGILARAREGSRVVLVGAGFIGCIILEALVSCGVELTVVEREERMVPRMLNRPAADMLRKWCEERGVAIYTSVSVSGVKEDGNGLAVSLEDGNLLNADLVVCAAGVAPNTGFLQGSGIETDAGVLVNDHLQSSHPDVYAAGDACQGRDFSTGGYSVQAIQPTAADHGRIAALNMAGRDVRHRGSVNMNVLDTLGLVSASFGLWMGTQGGDTAELHDPGRYRYLNLQFNDDVLVGAQSIGLTEHLGMLRGLIQTGVRLGAWKQHLMRDPTRFPEAYLGSTQPVGHNAGLI